MTKLYVAMEDELLVVTGRDGRWQLESRMSGMATECLAADPAQPERLFCGTFGQGLWLSQDAGASWEPAGQGISNPQVTAVAVSSIDRVGGHGVAWAGTEPSALFRSEDGGKSWEGRNSFQRLPSASSWSFPPRPWTHHVRWITPDATVPHRLFLCIEAGALIRSLDGGLTWEDRRSDGPRDTHTLRSHRLAPDRLYAAAGDGFMAPGMGYAESRDGGITWRRFGVGLHHHYLWSIAVDPGDPDRMVVSGAHGPREAHNPKAAESTVYRRAGGGEWVEVREGLPEVRGTIVPELAANEAEPGVFYLASNRGLFRSADAGLNWERLELAWPERFHHQHVRSLVVVD